MGRVPVEACTTGDPSATQKEAVEAEARMNEAGFVDVNAKAAVDRLGG